MIYGLTNVYDSLFITFHNHCSLSDNVNIPFSFIVAKNVVVLILFMGKPLNKDV